MDEIAAIPLFFWSWIFIVFFKTGSTPQVEYFLSKHIWPMMIGIFLAFRVFDIWKPWPARQSPSLPGGLGVTMDDALAAVYVNVVTLAVFGATVL
jgi:phosphatidylglycerophosphatase A